MQGVGIETDVMGAITFTTAVDRTSIPAEFAHMQGTGNAELVDQAHPYKAGVRLKNVDLQVIYGP